MSYCKYVFSDLRPSDKFFTEISNNVWLMDDHRWAFYAWEKFRAQHQAEKYSLLHIDHHWDSGYDFYCSKEKEQELLNADLRQIHKLVSGKQWIRLDSFIAPAVARGFIDEVHFYCTQDDVIEQGVDAELLNRTETKQYIHQDANSIFNLKFQNPLILDICLDLFNESENWYTGEIWPEQEIIKFIDNLNPTIKQAKAITISLSFGYSGSKADTKRIADIVIPRIIKAHQTA